MGEALTNRQTEGLTAGVLKALGIFGGVRALTILCSVVRTKVVAMWIGAAGVGLFGVYQSAIDMIGGLVQMSMGVAATRALADSKADKAAQGRLTAAVRRMCFLLAMAGALLTAVAAPWLSLWAFGDEDHTPAFRLLAICVLAMPLLDAEQGIMQGLQALRNLARASAWGAIGGLALSVPLLYLLGIDGIVPSLLAYALVTTVVMTIYGRSSSRRAMPAAPPRRWGESLRAGAGMARLGFFVTAAYAVTNVGAYIFIAWLSHTTDEATVGRFQAGYTLMNRYVGLIFTAMMVEYYPRLSRAAASGMRTSTFVGHEICIIMAGMCVVVPAFLACAPLLVRLLYSQDFMQVLPMVNVGILSCVFRGLSTAIAYVMLAKGDGRIFVITESISSVIYVSACMAGWLLGGLEGIGWALVVWYAAYTVSVWTVYRVRYRLRLAPRAVRLSLAALAVSALSLAAIILADRYTPDIGIGHIAAALIALACGAAMLRRARRPAL